MENRKKRRLRFAAATLVLGGVTAAASSILKEGGLRWVVLGAAFAFLIAALVSLVHANAEPD